MNKSFLLAAVLTAGALTVEAQYNDKGTFHVAIGLAAGAHGTEYEQTVRILGIPFTDTHTDGAATVTMPIELDYGFAKVFSLGLYVEPGAYLDSNATERNGLLLAGLQPRFYLVNGDRFALMASLQFGSSRLNIERDEDAVKTESRYRGGHFGLGAGAVFQFSDLIGLQVHLRYVGTVMTLQDYEVNGQGVSLDDFDAELRTRGVAIQTSLAFRF